MAYHKSLPSKDEDGDAEMKERAWIPSMVDFIGVNPSLANLAIFRVTRSRDGLFDMLESSLGGSESNTTR